MNDFRYKLARFFAGRTGVDALGRFVMYLAIILMLVTMISHSSVVYILSLICLGYSTWRMFSKNYQKRYYENQKYLNLTSGVRIRCRNIITWCKKKFNKTKYDMNQRKMYAIFYCPSCKQKLRAPKGKGKIQVTCNKCRCQFIKKV